MSRYGRLFDEANKVRNKIGKLLPKDSLPYNYTPEDARRAARDEARKLVAQVDALAAEWNAIEHEMAKEPG